MTQTSKLIRLAVLISGGGRTLNNLICLAREGKIPAQIVLVIASRPDAAGLHYATRAGIPTRVITRKDKSVDDFSREITAALDEFQPDLICLAGFMCFYHVPQHYFGHVINIHPALLPAFGGKGMFGHHVHEAVLNAGCKISGCTVHFADNVYDHGPIILQRTVQVSEDDTPDTLGAKVFEQEKIAYPDAISLFAQGRLKIEGRRVRILPEN